jgi:ABC-2 type transport system ATP-binding protein
MVYYYNNSIKKSPAHVGNSLTKPMIEIKNLKKTYGGHLIVDNLSLRIPSGSIVGFLGANGAGKTTTLKMIVGITSPDSGNILIDGKPVSDTDIKRNIGFMPELPSFYEYLSGKEFLVFCNTLAQGKDDFERKEADGLLKKVGLFDSRELSIGGYSKGMRQRLTFAQAIAHDPTHIFLDEPLDGLDPIGRKEFKKYIKELKARGKTIFFSSHILFDAEELCDEIAVIHKGSLVYAGNIPDFCAEKTLEKQFVDTIELLEKQKLS